MDPDLVRDPLPQPFRITELFETEIQDRTWIEPLQRHPDISIDSYGKQIVVPRNTNLTVSAVPYVIIDGKPSSHPANATTEFSYVYMSYNNVH